MTTRRRFFTATSALAAMAATPPPALADAATPPAALAAAAPEAAAAAPVAPSSLYDFPAIAGRLARPARHRQVFAVARVADGAALALMNHALDVYETAMGEGPGTLHPAAVVYGRGVVLGLAGTMWQRYRLGEALRRRGDELTLAGTAAAGGNPFADGFEHLAKRGATLFVCDNALRDWAQFAAAMTASADVTPLEILAEFRRNLLPGAMLVPAGVAALNMAQEARFTFVQAAL